MSIMDLKQTKEYFAETEVEAIELVEKIRADFDMVNHSITRKTKRIKGSKDEPGYDYEYWYVKIITQTWALKDLIDNVIG